MKGEEIYAHLHRRPFRPFALTVSSGQRFVVPHPEFAWMPRPDKPSIYLDSTTEGAIGIYVDQITFLEEDIQLPSAEAALK